MNTAACLICGSPDHRAAFVEDDIPILRCRACGHVWSTHPTVENYAGYFGYEPVRDNESLRFWDDAHRPMYADFCARFLRGKTGRLLDAGSGLGFFLRHVRNQTGWEAQGCEISSVAVDFARGHLGLGSIHHGSIHDLDAADASFDIVTLWDVIEHIANPDPFLGRLRTLLKPGGILFIHTPNASIQLPKAQLKRVLLGRKPGAHYLEARDHCHIYSPATLAKLLARNGFTAVRYVHLRPVQSVSGRSGPVSALLRNAWHTAAVVADRCSGGRCNIDNLDAVAR